MFAHFHILRISFIIAHLSLPFLLSLLTVSISYAQKTSTSTSISDNNETKIKYSNGSNSFDIEYKGEITLSDDDKDIIAISDGGFFEIQKKAFGSKRKVVIESERNGALNKRYFIGRKEKEYGPAGQSWLSNVLPEVIKATGLGAGARVKRLYNQGGLTAVLDYMDNIDSDHVRSIYYNYLLEEDLNSDDIVLLLKDIGQKVDSDHYMSDILRNHDDIFLISPSSTDAYINSVQSIESDHYMSEVLRDIIDNSHISDAQVISLLDISEGLQSDHYMSEVLKELIDERDLTTAQSTKLVELIGDINSDHYMTEVLLDLLDEKSLNNEVLSIVSSSLDNISSDHYLAEVIKSAARHEMDDKTLGTLLKSVNDNISSDHYHLESVSSILDHQNINLESNMNILLDNISGISSDNYASELIIKVADMDDINDAELIGIIMAIEDLNSDGYKVECLKSIADKINDDNSAVFKAYQNAARTISSETYYGQAMRAID